MADSTRKRVLIDLLQHQDAWRSGDELAADLGVTRETVWKAINNLRKAGHQIEARKSQGYRYAASPVLDADAISYHAHAAIPVTVLPSVESTQICAKAAVNSGASLPFAVIADTQTSGYGRRGRQFYSPAQSGLYMSIVLPNQADSLQNVGLLTTGVANAVVDVLEQYFPGHNFGLKWVNDVLLDGHKVGGIITEAVLELESASTAAFVIGIGLNLTTANFPRNLEAIAGAIATGTNVDRSELAAAILDHVAQMAGEYQTGAFLPVYRKRSVTIGHRVTLDLGLTQVTGLVVDIAANGGLMLQDAFGETTTYTAGEVIKVN
ncbi:biotin--[acetyl-CoA-carboxylase] ligase [Lacticaseibacillus hulanensis]|uniref:biotin--[acetyl-CoA-carboxylase] ligase n=1 Tax=Lacticaseibacillus hulanensis TaxID=2493111 RepID=UPI000FD82497|nr:biotin--[acetyl-CoA-carboxylase] ligase [Lacticaseibacillus hulanensis]